MNISGNDIGLLAGIISSKPLIYHRSIGFLYPTEKAEKIVSELRKKYLDTATEEGVDFLHAGNYERSVIGLKVVSSSLSRFFEDGDRDAIDGVLRFLKRANELVKKMGCEYE